MRFDLLKYQIPFPLDDEKDFQLFTKELFNEIFSTLSFQQRGSKGQWQGGFDVFSDDLRMAVECKKKDRNRSPSDLQKELSEEIQESLEKVQSVEIQSSHKFEKLIVVSTFRNDSVLQDKAAEVSTEKIKVEYWGWQTLKEHLNNCETLKTKYYPFMTELNQTYYSPSRTKQKNTYRAGKDNRHVLEQIHETAERFLPLVVLKKYTLKDLYPFNNTDQRAHHFNYTLEIKNANVAKFLKGLNQNDFGDLIIGDDIDEVKKIDDYELKIRECIYFLRYNFAHKIETSNHGENFTLPTLHRTEKCACEKCNYDNQDFASLLNQISENNKNYNCGSKYEKLRNAFVNFKVGNFKQAFYQLKNVLDNSKKS